MEMEQPGHELVLLWDTGSTEELGCSDTTPAQLLPADTLVKTVEGGPSAWGPATTWEAPGFSLAQPQLVQPFGQSTTRADHFWSL